MSTVKAVYIGSSQVLPETSHTINGVTGALRLNLIEIDWGKTPKIITTTPRALLDGELRRGSRVGGRSFSWALAGYINPSAVTTVSQWERYRDAALDYIDGLLHVDGGLLTLKQTRLDAAGAAVSRVIYAEATAMPAWKWSPDNYGPGLVGSHGMPHFIVPIEWAAPFPWFIDTTATTGTNADSGGTTATITNPGTVACGIQVIVVNDSTETADFSISLSQSSIIASITVTGLAMTAGTEYLVDAWMTDPVQFQLCQNNGSSGVPGGASFRSKVSALTGTWLIPSTTSVTLAGTIGGGGHGNLTFTPRWRSWWSNP